MGCVLVFGRSSARLRGAGIEDSKQLMFQRGGFSVLVKRVAKYEVIGEAGPTVVTVSSPETLSRADCCTRRRRRT